MDQPTQGNSAHSCTCIPELDAFIKAEIELIGGETNAEDKAKLWRVLYAGMRTILSAQLNMPVEEDFDYKERAERKIRIIREYLINLGGAEKPDSKRKTNH